MEKVLLLLAFVFIFAKTNLFSQNCYIQQQDASGLNADSYQTELEEAACALIATFPEEFQENFKVHDFGFYLHIMSTLGGMESVLERMEQIAAQESPYYMIVTKILSSENFIKEFKVNLKLPNEGVFDCIDETKIHLMEKQISEKINSAYNETDISHLADAIQKGIVELKENIEEIKNGNCCPFNKETLEVILYEKGYISLAAKFINNPVEVLGAKSEEVVEDYANFLVKIKGQEVFDDFKTVLEREVSFATDAEVNVKAFITKHENICEDIGDDILNGFKDIGKEAYIHCHFSPNSDSSQWGLLFLYFESKELITTDSPPEMLIDDSPDCSPWPLPFLPENQYNYAITKNSNEAYHGFKYDAGLWNESDIVEGKTAINPDLDKEKTWGDKGAFYTTNTWGFTEYHPSFIAWSWAEGFELRGLVDDLSGSDSTAEVLNPTTILEYEYHFAFQKGFCLDEKNKIFQQFKYPKLFAQMEQH